MPITNESEQIQPRLIYVGDRQRKEVKTGDLLDSIKQYNILVPLIVRREMLPGDETSEDRITLVAGHRRLMCAIELDFETVPVRYYDTLDPLEAKIIELEENIKREDLPWRDQVLAIGNFDKLKKESDTEWTSAKTAEALSYTQRQIQYVLSVFTHIDTPAIVAADNLSHAIGILQRISERKTASLVEELLRAPSSDSKSSSTDELSLTYDNLGFDGKGPHDPLNEAYENIDTSDISEATEEWFEHAKLIKPSKSPSTTTPINPVIVTDFISWAANYSGPKFNLIHCDFPYGVHASDATIEHYENTKEIFWNLTEALTTNLDKLLSYSAHVMFWLNFEYYETVKIKLSGAGLHVINRPLIWVKSDTKGAAPGIRGTQPRHSYEIAFLAYRGNRPLVRQGTDSYSAQTVTNPIHPTQKPESMLKHFLSMLIDNVTDFLDPTCGSGSSLCAADYLGARTVVGIEQNPEYAAAANASIMKARRLAQQSKTIVEGKQDELNA